MKAFFLAGMQTALLSVCLSTGAAPLDIPVQRSHGEEGSVVEGVGEYMDASGQTRTESLRVIYSNFDEDPQKLYQPDSYWGIYGPLPSPDGFQSVAMPFTPAESGTVRKIVVALSHLEGRNAVTVTMRSNSSGLPGKVIESFVATGLQPAGSCCSTEAVVSQGIPVVAGVKYWVVVRAWGDTRALWNKRTGGKARGFAFDGGDGWAHAAGDFCAFAVLGE